MTEKIEPNLQAKEFNSDKERLEFLEKNIVEHIQNALNPRGRNKRAHIQNTPEPILKIAFSNELQDFRAKNALSDKE